MLVSRSSYHSLSSQPGVYLYLDENNRVIYVGKAKNLKNRVSSYFINSKYLQPKTQLLVSQIAKIKTIVVESELEALLLEANLIKKYKPKYNIELKDNKAYPLIRITYNNLYPAVLTARKIEDKDSIYFGPYPSSSSMRIVLRTLRRIFPFQSVINHPKKICLYHHLGLCPCIPVFENNRKEYKRNIKFITDFLAGKTQKVLKGLKREREKASKEENFESAQTIQKQINSINYVTHPIHKPFEYEINPNLREDIRMQELIQLEEVLNNHAVNVKSLNRIECYDISNISGTNPTASMVVLTDGEVDKSQYRKFKMKTKGPNDFAMMQEVLTRRLKHSEWQTPGLIIVDGGKGQISSAKKILQEKKTDIPLVGLAKREEIIITSDFQEINLPKRSKALQLVMRIRDEAHRFAVTYHKKLRSKNFLARI